MDYDAIIPDDLQETAQPEVEQAETLELTAENDNENINNEGDTISEGTNKEQEAPKFKVKYNHQEYELGYDEAIPLIQKGMNYDKIQERLRSLEADPRLTFVEELAQESGMSVEEYLEAVREAREQEKLNQLIQQNIPEDLAREIIENRKFREQLEAEKHQREAEEARQREFLEFVESFPDVKPDQIPAEVWETYQKGVPLKYAYLQYDYNNLKNQLQILKQNEENQKKAPVGSVTTYGGKEPSIEDDFLRGFNSI